jgi:MFS family permease
VRRRRATGGRPALRPRVEAVRNVLRNPDLRRLELGWGAFFLVDWTMLVALSVWAFERDGASAVGIIGFARLVPGAVALPFGAWAADRFPRQRVATLVFLSMSAVSAAVATAILTDAPVGVVYGLTALWSVVAAPYRPAQLALVPLLARSPEELVAANVTSGWLEGLATFIGPLVAALMLLAAGPALVVAVAAVVSLGAVVCVAGIRVPIDPSRVVRQRHETPAASLLGGLRELREDAELTLIVGCFVTQLLVRGVLGVLLVALSFELLDLGDSGVGWLGAAMGVGGLIGAVLTLSLTGRRQLGRPFALGLALWGLPIALIGAVPSVVVALVALAIVGIGNSVLDVAGFTLLQRLGDDRTLGRLFGVVYTFGIAVGGVGAIAAPSLIAALGVRGVLVVVGMLLPVLALAVLPRLRGIDAHSEPPPDRLDVIASVPMLSPLPPTTLEKIASRCASSDVAPGEAIVREGALGDRFYAIVAGEVEVSKGGVRLATLTRGDSFGEIALVRGSPRTATVTATRETQLVSLAGRDFLDAINGSDVAFATAVRVSDERRANG